MTNLLTQAIDRARRLPPSVQDEIARAVMALAEDRELVYHLTAEERADIAAADEELARGEVATDVDVDRMWTRPIL